MRTRENLRKRFSFSAGKRDDCFLDGDEGPYARGFVGILLPVRGSTAPQPRKSTPL